MHQIISIRNLSIGVTVAALALFGIMAGHPEAQDGTPAASATPEPIVLDVLVNGMPEQALGNVLELVRYTIQPGVTLPAHTHPGMQIAWIDSGVLTYAVVEGGEIPVTRATDRGTPGEMEMLGPGEQTELHPGDTVVEIDGVVHYGANLGDEPVVILASTLLDNTKPSAEVVEVAATPLSE